MASHAGWLIAGVLLLSSCGRDNAPQRSAEQADAGGLAPLPARPEVVALADKLAVDGHRAAGDRGVELTLRAANLRQRLWRMERREADALEAIELFRSAERSKAASGCEARLARVLLEGEFRSDPAASYRDLYALSLTYPKTACAERARSALAALSAYKPAASVLAEIDRRHQSSAEKGPLPVGSGRVEVDAKGPVVVPTLGKGAAGPVKITRIERYAAEDSARVVVLLTRPATFDAGFIPAGQGDRGPRLFVDIHAATYDLAPAFEMSGLVQRVRVGAQKNATRVVLDLTGEVYRRIFYLPEPFRLIIDVSKNRPKTPELAPRGRRVLHRVVLDPGHGGHDPGAVGPAGLREKDVTLDIAHRAAPLIARELGIATLLTRDSDAFVPLDERAARANAFRADLFVSIHCNARENGHGNSVMTFVLDESHDALAAKIAARENAASAAAGAELASVMRRVLDVSSVNQSLDFANLLQRSAMASISPAYPGVRDGGVRRAGFYVLAGAHMPAVLFETSFISNDSGESRLNIGDYRQKMADAVVNAIRAYRQGH